MDLVSMPRMVRLKKGYRFWFALLVGTLVDIPCLILASLFSQWRAQPRPTSRISRYLAGTAACCAARRFPDFESLDFQETQTVDDLWGNGDWESDRRTPEAKRPGHHLQIPRPQWSIDYHLVS